MTLRCGLGPVFAYEWLTTTRRWQVYAARSGFVGCILVGMILLWWMKEPSFRGREFVTIRELAQIGEGLYAVIVGVQLTLVMLAAPAATAGAVCLDKARGTLLHVLTTDLSNTEIVLGKLAVRLAPVVGMVCCVLPVMALGTLLGGLDPDALFGAFLVTLGVAVLGCSLALTLSVWGRKTHEVLLATYLFLVLWISAAPFFWVLRMSSGIRVGGIPGYDLWHLLKYANPFYLVYVPYASPGEVGGLEFGLFFLGCLILSAGMAVLAIARIRVVTIHQSGRVEKTSGGWAPRIALNRPWWLTPIPGPSLDFNPVLWREWHRSRPSRWMRIVWGIFLILAVAVTSVALDEVLRTGFGRPRGELTELGNGFQIVVSLLLLSVGAATSLSEERVRGSLDVLLTTPLTTLSILAGKWWGAYRLVPRLLILPGAVAFVLAWDSGRWFTFLLFLGLFLAYGAVITSLGLALATWIPRLGRALGACVSIYILFTVGWVFMAVMIDMPGTYIGPSLAIGSPFFGGIFGTAGVRRSPALPSGLALHLEQWLLFWTMVHTAVGVALFLATWLTFDRFLGRVSD